MSLITIDPYFSVWSAADELNRSTTVHWTGSPVVMFGIVTVDGKKFCFMGRGDDLPAIEQTKLDVTVLNTKYRFENESILLDVNFYTSLFTDDLYRLSRPVSYFDAVYSSKDGSFRLVFDRPDTFSMKYNYVWDKLWHTKLFPPCVFNSEFASNKKHINPYGMPLDSRKSYTKSDWLVWTAELAPTYGEFIEFITPLWRAYNVSMSRVPMTDWFDTDTANIISFQNRTVQGGLFIKLLEGKF